MKIKKISKIGVASALALGIVSSSLAFADTTPKITLEQAKAIALADANLKESDVTFHTAKLDSKDNEYDIEFYTSTKEYDYEINSNTGAIVEKDNEIKKRHKDTNTTSTTKKHNSTKGSSSSSANKTKKSKSNTTSSTTKSYPITLEQAKNTALKDANLKESDVTMFNAKLDKKDGSYDIEFYTANKEYDYKIDANTGKIKEKDNEIKKRKINRTTQKAKKQKKTANSNKSANSENTTSSKNTTK